MRIIVPIEYEIQGTTLTNRRMSRHYYRELVAVDIAEFEDAEAPVAIRWSPSAAASRLPSGADRAISGPDGKQITRWHGDHHWQRLCEGHLGGRMQCGPAVTPSRLEKALASPLENHAAMSAIGMASKVDDLLRQKIKETSSDPRTGFISIRSDGRAAQMAHLEEVISGLVCVDGVVYRKCFEPFITVPLRFEDGALVAWDIGVETSSAALWGDGTATAAVWSVSEWDEATRFAIEQGIAETIPSPPEVILDHSLTYDWDISFKAAFEIRKLSRFIEATYRIRDHRLAGAAVSQEAEEQYGIMLSFDPNDPRWADNGTVRRSYDEIMSILADREISLLPRASQPPRSGA